MVKHLVMWNIKPELDKEETIAELKRRLEVLPKSVPGLKHLEIGVHYKKGPSGRDIVLYSELDSKEALEAYLIHPDHVEAGAYVKQVVCDRVDVDYDI